MSLQASIAREGQSTSAIPEIREIFTVISSISWHAYRVEATAKNGGTIFLQSAQSNKSRKSVVVVVTTSRYKIAGWVWGDGIGAPERGGRVVKDPLI